MIHVIDRVTAIMSIFETTTVISRNEVPTHIMMKTNHHHFPEIDLQGSHLLLVGPVSVLPVVVREVEMLLAALESIILMKGMTLTFYISFNSFNLLFTKKTNLKCKNK